MIQVLFQHLTIHSHLILDSKQDPADFSEQIFILYRVSFSSIASILILLFPRQSQNQLRQRISNV